MGETVGRVKYLLKSYFHHILSNSISTGETWIDEYHGLNNIKNLSDYFEKKKLKARIQEGYVSTPLIGGLNWCSSELSNAISETITVLGNIDMGSKQYDTYYLSNGYTLYYERTHIMHLHVINPQREIELKIRYNFQSKEYVEISHIKELSFPCLMDVAHAKELHALKELIEGVNVPSFHYR